MLHKAKTLKDYTLNSLDGEIGKVREFYFDDQHWGIRYLVADTGNWLTGRQVLISPYALGNVISDGKHLTIKLTKRQIEDSPPLDSDKPVSRQFSDHRYAELVVGEKGLDCTFMDRARQLDRVESLRQPSPRDHQAGPGIHG